jgi:deoxyadenosine/deoxycytidine kinase
LNPNSFASPHQRPYVVVTGAVAAGASTLADVLIGRLGWEGFLDSSVEDHNRFFADAYRDFSRWGFHSQLHFLTRSAGRHARLQKMLATAGPAIVEDRTPFEHTGAYLRALEALGRIPTREAELLRATTTIIEGHFVIPDVLVYRQMSPEQLLSRVRQRGRTGEDAADFELFDALRISFDTFVEQWDRGTKIIVPATVDVHDAAALAAVISQIEIATAATK